MIILIPLCLSKCLSLVCWMMSRLQTVTVAATVASAAVAVAAAAAVSRILFPIAPSNCCFGSIPFHVQWRTLFSSWNPQRNTNWRVGDLRRLVVSFSLSASLFLSPSLTPLIVISVCPSLSFFLPLSRSVSLPGWESLFMRMVITGVRRCSPSPSPKDLQSKLLTQRAAVHQHYEITHVFGNLRRSKAIWQLSKLIRFFFCSVYYYAPWRIGDWPEDTSPYEDWPMTYSKSIRRSDTKSS